MLLYQHPLQYGYQFLTSAPPRTLLCLLCAEHQHNENNQSNINKGAYCPVAHVVAFIPIIFMVSLSSSHHCCHHSLGAHQVPGAMLTVLPTWPHLIPKPPYGLGITIPTLRTRKLRLRDARVIEPAMTRLDLEPKSVFKAYVLNHFTMSHIVMLLVKCHLWPG